MRPLVIDEAARKELARVREFAEANPIPQTTLKAMITGNHPPPGDYPEWTAELPHGWRVVFTVEDQPMGRVRHLSVSVDARHQGKCPNPVGIAAIASELGFLVNPDTLEYVHARCFPDPDIGWLAPNVIEPLDPIV